MMGGYAYRMNTTKQDYVHNKTYTVNYTDMDGDKQRIRIVATSFIVAEALVRSHLAGVNTAMPVDAIMEAGVIVNI